MRTPKSKKTSAQPKAPKALYDNSWIRYATDNVAEGYL